MRLTTLMILAAFAGSLAACETEGDYAQGPRPDYDDQSRGYDPYRDYRDDPRYQEYALSSNDRIYRGSDGRYYCKRSDGTTGLVVGALAGGVLGDIIAPRHSKTLGVILGASGGAIAGAAIDSNNVRCR